MGVICRMGIMLVYRLPGAKRIRSAFRIALRMTLLTRVVPQYSTDTCSIGKRRRLIDDFLCPLTATPLLYLNTSWPGVDVAGCRQPEVTPMAREMVPIPAAIESRHGGLFLISPSAINMAGVRIRFPRKCPPGIMIGPFPPGETYLPRNENHP